MPVTAASMEGVDPTDLVRLHYGSEDEVTIHRHGATIISWRQAGQERLFLSSQAKLDGSKPIRGGIPLVFPQFGTGPIMAGQHGFARQVPWAIEVTGVDQAVGRLSWSEATMAQWPHRFSLEYTIHLSHGELETTLTITNVDDHAWEFTALLHTYLRRQEGQVVEGLAGLHYRDKLDGKVKVEEANVINIDCEIDRAYLDVQQAEIGDLQIKQTGFSDLVVWNPWVEKSRAMADFGDEEYREMVCLEPGVIKNPISLAPGASWSGTQTLSLKR